MQMAFRNPDTSLNLRQRVGNLIAESMRVDVERSQRRSRRLRQLTGPLASKNRCGGHCRGLE